MDGDACRYAVTTVANRDIWGLREQRLPISAPKDDVAQHETIGSSSRRTLFSTEGYWVVKEQQMVFTKNTGGLSQVRGHVRTRSCKCGSRS